MNDTELDEMLNQWKSPAMRDSLREDLRAEFAVVAGPQRRGLVARAVAAASAIRLGRLAIATIGVTALVFAYVQLTPKTARTASPAFRIPFYVDFAFTSYPVNGGTPYQSRITTFPYAGHEINMSVVESGGPLLTAVRQIAASVRNQAILLMPSLVIPKQPPQTEPAWFAGFVRSGCTQGRNVVGQEIIAGHQTSVMEGESPTARIKVWEAPDLDCFALKVTNEIRQPDGSYRFQVRKEAVRVTMNP